MPDTEVKEMLADALHSERELVDALMEVLHKYMDYVDPEDNDYDARKWQDEKRKLAAKYKEILVLRTYLSIFGE